MFPFEATRTERFLQMQNDLDFFRKRLNAL